MTTTRPRRLFARPLTWLVVLVALAVIVALAFIGVRLYAQSQNDAAPEAFGSESAEAGGSTGVAGDVAGEWTVAEGSEAGYRVDEVLNGEDVTVVGRTSEVTGDVTIEDTTLTEGTITVDLASVRTDDGTRDQYFATQAIDTNQFPEAVFTVDEGVDVAALAEEGSASVEVPGTVELNGQSQEAVVSMQATRTDAGLEITGSSDVTWSDYGVEAPDMAVVTVEDAGQIEFSLQLTQG